METSLESYPQFQTYVLLSCETHKPFTKRRVFRYMVHNILGVPNTYRYKTITNMVIDALVMKGWIEKYHRKQFLTKSDLFVMTQVGQDEVFKRGVSVLAEDLAFLYKTPFC